MDVKLIIYDVLGREVTTLVNKELKPGSYEVEFHGGNYTSGIYFYKLETADFSEVRKMVLIK
jgi:5-hydroxyisourate hydrolase-like protein (transthyretin family)